LESLIPECKIAKIQKKENIMNQIFKSETLTIEVDFRKTKAVKIVELNRLNSGESGEVTLRKDGETVVANDSTNEKYSEDFIHCDGRYLTDEAWEIAEQELSKLGYSLVFE
jgi:hypothetical protein